jgi:rRNA maturation RNase YbeY
MSIEYVYNTTFSLDDEKLVSRWLVKAAKSEGYSIGELVYAFFDDKDLKNLNNRYLGRDYFTDVISFNDSVDNILNGNIAISIERVLDNSKKFNVPFQDELLRVMVHGLLHFMGYDDSSVDEAKVIRKKEDDNLKAFHVEQ